MPIKNGKTKRGLFHVEWGSAKDKAEPSGESPEVYYRWVTPGSIETAQTFEMFIE